MTEILKSYQDEIDTLTKRAKNIENAYIQVAKSLLDAPDPYVALEGLKQDTACFQSQSLEMERLKNEIIQYDIEFQQLVNQDITIRK